MSKTPINKLPLIIISAILLGAILPMTVRGNSDAGTPAASGDSLSYNDRRRYDYFFIEAIRKQNAGDYAAAFDLLNHCLEIKPDAAEAYYARASYFSEMQNDSLALRDIEKAATLSPGNDTYQERVAQYYIGSGNYDKAITAYENLFEHHKDRSDVLNILVQLYNQKKDYKNMLGAIERIEQIEGSSDELTLAKMNVYEMKGDTKMAEKTLRSLTETHPNDAIYKVMYGNWLLQKGKKEEAYGMLSAALKDDPDNEAAQSSMYDYYRSAGQDSLAIIAREQKDLFHDQDIDAQPADKGERERRRRQHSHTCTARQGDNIRQARRRHSLTQSGIHGAKEDAGGLGEQRFQVCAKHSTRKHIRHKEAHRVLLEQTEMGRHSESVLAVGSIQP